MKFGKVFVIAAMVAAITGLTACVPDPEPAQSTRPAPSSSSSPPTPAVSASPSGSASPTSEPEPVPTDGSSPEPQPKQADVQIIDARYDPTTSAISVAGMVVNIVSNDGLCTATATQNGVVASAAVAGVADASVTYCASLVVQLPPASTGEWTVSLTYDEDVIHGDTTTSVVVG